ncbi:unnamed protein product [Mucor hiemalis]
MSQDATYGGNMELAAFAKMREVDIKVYQPGMIYIINGKEGAAAEEEEDVTVLHIAYHSWEHYSSVRNIDGPITGPPEIKINKVAIENDKEPEGSDKDEIDENLNSKEKQILRACPSTNIRKIRRLLIKNKGDPNKVIDTLYEDNMEAENGKDNGVVDEAPQILEKLESVPMTEEELIIPSHPTDIPSLEAKKIVSSEANNTEITKIDEEAEEELEDTGNEVTDVSLGDNSTEGTLNAKPKKSSARERKIEQKRKQKENNS